MAAKPDFYEKDAIRNDSPEIEAVDKYEDGGGSQLGFWTKMGCTPESFKPRTAADANSQLNQTLKHRHLHMIAIGGSIGAGLFVGSGSALSNGVSPSSASSVKVVCDALTKRIIGPCFCLDRFPDYWYYDFQCWYVVSYFSLLCTRNDGTVELILLVVYALGELAVMYPVSGGFYTYSTRFVDPAWGFAMGYNYVFQWAIVLPLELVVAGFTIEYWNVNVSVAVWISVFLVAIILINVFGVLGYGEEEFWTSALKLSAVIIFMITALVLVLGGGPSDGAYSEYWGARLWYDPGAFRNGFQGFCSVFVTAAFSFAGTELVGLAAAESKNPAKSLPGAIKQVFWRITL